jgi:hypothetical protein
MLTQLADFFKHALFCGMGTGEVAIGILNDTEQLLHPNA